MDALLFYIGKQILYIAAALLAALKAEQNIAFQLVLAVQQSPGCSQQHGSMGIVSAGVHHTLIFAPAGTGSVEVLLLQYRQGITVRPQQHSFPIGILSMDPSQDAAILHDGMLDSHGCQFCVDLPDGFIFKVSLNFL